MNHTLAILLKAASTPLAAAELLTLANAAGIIDHAEQAALERKHCGGAYMVEAIHHKNGRRESWLTPRPMVKP